MRMKYVLAITGGLLIGLMASTWSLIRLAQSQETPGRQQSASKPAAKGSSELVALEASAVVFETAFNKKDAAAIAEQFTENAEAIDEDGNVTRGREAIQARFAALFKEHPKAQIAVELTALRQLSPDVAVEDGYSTTILNPEDRVSRSPYTVVHLKREGKWLIASVRDFPEETQPTPREHLEPLAWLVGDWVDQSGDAKVETSCKWSDDGNYLIQEFKVKLRQGIETSGTQRIGWDPLRRTIRSWAFDHSGGFGEAIWTAVDGGWVIRAEGVTPDGRAASVTRILTPLDSDLFDLVSTQRLVGGELLPDTTVRVARRPPAPTAP